jgi:hypothetical protein
MLHAGLDLSRKKVDVCLLSDQGEQSDLQRHGQLGTSTLVSGHAGDTRTTGSARRARHGGSFGRDQPEASGRMEGPAAGFTYPCGS